MGRNKDAAVGFLKMVVAGKIDEAYAKYVDMKGKHHNVFTPAGFEALKKGMIENEGMFPNKKFDIQRVVEEGDMVATHSHIVLKPGELELGVVHWFRFKDGKIAELWDVGQQVPKETVNQDGMF
ncbi:MAG TPA: nuclear transport factor 2 family protein [bacterium]|nr:nuclear transport factor 2 family protein [bacterium]